MIISRTTIVGLERVSNKVEDYKNKGYKQFKLAYKLPMHMHLSSE